MSQEKPAEEASSKSIPEGWKKDITTHFVGRPPETKPRLHLVVAEKHSQPPPN